MEGKISDKQVAYIKDLLEQNGTKVEDIEHMLGKKITDLSKSEASSLIDKIRSAQYKPDEHEIVQSAQTQIQPEPMTNLVDADVESAKKAMQKFLQLKNQVLDHNDFVDIAGKAYIKRSGWRKIALAFNISTDIIEVQRIKEGDTMIVYTKAKATAPNGRYAIGTAVCDSTEFETGKLKGTLHNIETKSATRAINRAISDLVGGGEVSAEEVE